MDESNSEEARWRLSRYAPPATAFDRIAELEAELLAERERVQTLANALQQILNAVEHLGHTMEKVGKQ